MNWEKIHCICGEKRKRGSTQNKIWFQGKMSDKRKGKMVFYCTNTKNPEVHSSPIHFTIELFLVHDQITDVNNFVTKDKYPEEKPKKNSNGKTKSK